MKHKKWIIKEYVHGGELENVLNDLYNKGYKIIKLWKISVEFSYYTIVAKYIGTEMELF